MGVGTAQDFFEAVARGIDMFDCVMPTRNGRKGNAEGSVDDLMKRLTVTSSYGGHFGDVDVGFELGLLVQGNHPLGNIY
jgi:hypothetical protein